MILNIVMHTYVQVFYYYFIDLISAINLKYYRNLNSAFVEVTNILK